MKNAKMTVDVLMNYADVNYGEAAVKSINIGLSVAEDCELSQGDVCFLTYATFVRMFFKFENFKNDFKVFDDEQGFSICGGYGITIDTDCDYDCEKISEHVVKFEIDIRFNDAKTHVALVNAAVHFIINNNTTIEDEERVVEQTIDLVLATDFVDMYEV